ncbi:MAG TPA: hypothetical protein DEP47_06725, partial [Chloroflexi bacterium]|nr:hypothetical protein [Chloroflexota bacterium]
AMHITASVFINDDEYGLHQDYEKWLEELAPHRPIDQAVNFRPSWVHSFSAKVVHSLR